MANGIEMFLALKKSAMFSQYRRAEEIPVFVSQYSVMLSRMSSCVGRPRASQYGPSYEPGLAGTVAVVRARNAARCPDRCGGS